MHIYTDKSLDIAIKNYGSGVSVPELRLLTYVTSSATPRKKSELLAINYITTILQRVSSGSAS